MIADTLEEQIEKCDLDEYEPTILRNGGDLWKIEKRSGGWYESSRRQEDGKFEMLGMGGDPWTALVSCLRESEQIIVCDKTGEK
jgi:hypothetical protein